MQVLEERTFEKSCEVPLYNQFPRHWTWFIWPSKCSQSHCVLKQQSALLYTKVSGVNYCKHRHEKIVRPSAVWWWEALCVWCGVVWLCLFGSLDVNELVYILFIVAVLVLMLLWGGDLLHCGHKERTRCLLCLTKSTTISVSVCLSFTDLAITLLICIIAYTFFLISFCLFLCLIVLQSSFFFSPYFSYSCPVFVWFNLRLWLSQHPFFFPSFP